jgi:hypothetical protein
MFQLPFRQIHLDFHTSQHIAGIGSQFDPDEFADTLARAHVNSVTCFARCHHGYLYYDSPAFPQRRHPHLQRNLLSEQIAACHARGIRVPIYTSVQWDHLTADQHPEWLCLTDQGAIKGTKPFEAGFYRFLCLNSPYVDFLKGHVAELFEVLPAVDGLFLDIVLDGECCCPRCIAAMRGQGLDPARADQRKAFGLDLFRRFQRDMTAHIRRFSRDCTIFYNGGHVGPVNRATADAFSHFELESLPSASWGYMHFPVAQRYARTLGLECLGMTGKFHTSWGDFGSLKNRAALEFECFRMLALNAKCSIGDQLHPTGRPCQATYELIGSVYEQVQAKEPWCSQAKPVTEAAIITTESGVGGGGTSLPPSVMGAVRMLQEGQIQFDVLDPQSEFEPYKALVLPDELTVGPELVEKLDRYLSAGGAIIASYRSGLDDAGRQFALPGWPVQLVGDAPFSPDFIVPAGELAEGLPQTPLVMYLRGLEVTPAARAEVLAQVQAPYFNRTWEHFCSHRHTPSSGKVGYVGAVRAGGIIYFAHPIFTQYHRNAPSWCKRMVLNALEMLIGQPMVQVAGPSTVTSSLNDQPALNRRVLHLLHYIPERRGLEFDVIEDVIPLHELHVSLAVGRAVSRVSCVPENLALNFVQGAGRLDFILPRLAGHQIIEIAWAQ